MIERNVTVVTPETACPISLSEAKEHLRVEGSAEDAFIVRLISAATEFAQLRSGRQYVTASLKQSMEEFPEEIELLCPPLQSTTVVVTYADDNGIVQTLSSADYQVSKTGIVGRIKPAYSKSWPTTRIGVYNAVEVVYTAGYGAGSAVPGTAKQAILLLIGHWYTNREAVLTGPLSKAIEFAVDSLLAMERVFSL